jgi:uncharacterized protein
MANNPVNWFEIYVQEMERAREFYEAMLQTKLKKLNSTVPELWAFPQSFTDYARLALWPKWKASHLAATATAHWSTSVAGTAR